jgi:DNA-binding NarL/FixJ family response regulator
MIVSASTSNCLDELTKRELEVLALMAEGLTNLAIAQQLFLTERSVEKYVTSILYKVVGLPEHKLRINRRVTAVLRYLEYKPVRD